MLGIPEDYTHDQLALVSQKWIDHLLETGRPTAEFIRHPELTGGDVIALIKERKRPPEEDGNWRLIEVDSYALDPTASALSLPELNVPFASDEWTTAEAMHYVSQVKSFSTIELSVL